jgi:hypothetical protein
MWALAMVVDSRGSVALHQSANPMQHGFCQSLLGASLPRLDQNGYPIGLGNLPAKGDGAFTFVYTHNGLHYQTGTYTLTFDGKGTIEILNGYQTGVKIRSFQHVSIAVSARETTSAESTSVKGKFPS